MIQAKKSLGQHFLHDASYAERLAEAVTPGTRQLVEIGPGTGMLTQFLINRSELLLLIEKDHRLAALSAQKWAALSHVSVIEEDVLKFNFRKHLCAGQFTLVGNFPYNISSQIVFRVLELRDLVPEMIGMFQYEMAKRIVAGPGSKDYGVISVLAALHYDSKLLFEVPPKAFMPPPKVNSAVIRLDRKQEELFDFDERSFRIIVKAAFSQRRKMLRNTLKGLLPGAYLQEVFFEKRPEHVSLSDFKELTRRYEQERKNEPPS